MVDMLYHDISMPSEARDFLKRPQVVSLLKNAIQKPLTTVVAGAGYGKTQAVLSALESNEYNIAWLQLSVLDNRIDRFWERLSYSLKPYSQVLSDKMAILGYPESIAAVDHFLHLLSRECIQKKRFVVVLDDFHYISNKTISDFFELFISAHIQNVSIILISRKAPDLSHAWMMSKDLLFRITEDDLRFSRQEMELYLRKKDITLKEDMINSIYSYTDGWVFAIYLVGLSIKNKHINKQNPLAAVKVDIFNLIEKEIFSKASKELQDFLIKIAMLWVIPAGLMRELANDNVSLITEMTQLSMLVHYDAPSDSYRIHHLFKEFITEKKPRPEDDESKAVYLTAADWFNKEGNKTVALIHYQKCGRYDDIFGIILSFTHHIAKETADLLIKIIEEAPDEFLEEKPIMRVVRAKLKFNNNRIDEAKRELLIIQEMYEALPKTEANLSVLGEAYVMLALISMVNQDYGFVELFKKADACLPNGSSLVNPKFDIAEGLNVCSIKESAPGELKRHQDTLFNIAPYAVRVMNGCGYGIESLNAAESSLYTGNLKSAEKYAYEAVYKSKKYLQYDIEYMANFVLVRVFTAKGNYAKVVEILNQLQGHLATFQFSGCISLYDIIQGWFYVKIGKIDEVPRWFKYEEETRKMFAPVILGRDYLVRSDLLLAEERYYELLGFIKQTDHMYESRGILYATIQNKLTEAIIHHYLGDYEESIKKLNEAYDLASPNGLTMQWVEYGNKMRTLIYNARRNEKCRIPKEWLNHIYTKSSAYAKQLAWIVTDYDADHVPADTNKISLSKREFEVFTQLYRGFTREEISVNCYLSLSTVNTMLKKIYNKLGAANLADAIRIAKEKHVL